MKNCNCKENKTVAYNDKCVTRLLIDECTGNKVHYITLASAVLMDCNQSKTVKDVLEEIQEKVDTCGYDPEELHDLFVALFNDWVTHFDNILNQTDVIKNIKFKASDENLPVSDGVATLTPAMTGVIFVKSLYDTVNDADYTISVKGDINGDGVVDVSDIDACASLITGLKSNSDFGVINDNGEYIDVALTNGDCNDDRKVDATDLNMIINYALGIADPKYTIQDKEGNPYSLIPGLTYYNVTSKCMFACLKTGKISSQSSLWSNFEERLRTLENFYRSQDIALLPYVDPEDPNKGRLFAINIAVINADKTIVPINDDKSVKRSIVNNVTEDSENPGTYTGKALIVNADNKLSIGTITTDNLHTITKVIIDDNPIVYPPENNTDEIEVHTGE